MFYARARCALMGAAVLLCSAVHAEEWTAGAPAPQAHPDNTALAERACVEFQGADVPPEVLRDAGVAPAAPSQPGAADASGKELTSPRSGRRPGKGQPEGTRALRRIPFLISLLCQDRTTNQDAIASLYLAFKGNALDASASSTALPAVSAGPSEHMASQPPGRSARPSGTVAATPSAPTTEQARARLDAAADRFIGLRVDNEIESTLREKIYTTTNNAQILHARFERLVADAERGELPGSATDDRRANQDLARISHLLDERTLTLGGERAVADFHETQAAWLAYRNAWVGFLAAAHPDLARKPFVTALTEERSAQLRAFYATGERP